VPTSSGNVIINTNAGNQPVVSTGNATAGNVTIGLDSSSGATTALTIQNGWTLSATNAYLGNNTGSNATATVTGANSTWSVDGSEFVVGRSGNGSLTVSDGGNISGVFLAYIGEFFGSNGTATVTGTNSTWNAPILNVGDSGNGSLTISDSGNVTTALSTVGSMSGSYGMVLVTGNQSTWNIIKSLAVGGLGNGTLTISGGGNVTAGSSDMQLGDSGESNIGESSGGNGTVQVTGANSTLTIPNSLYVGDSGSGNLIISQGGSVISGGSGNLFIPSRSGNGSIVFTPTNVDYNTLIGFYSGSSGNVSVDGAGSEWITKNDLIIGNSGNGLLAVSNGGNVTTIGDSIAGNTSSSNGTVTVDGSGSKWIGSGNLTVGNSGNGTLNITNGGNVTANSSYIGVASGSNGTVSVSGLGSSFYTTTYNSNIGVSGTGSLTVSNGARAGSFVVYTTIGENSGSNGTLSVTGANSMYNSGVIDVGDYGNGSLVVSDGGDVSSVAQIQLGLSPGTVGTALVTNASVEVSRGDLYVGGTGTGNLSIINGSALTSGSANFGFDASGAGTALINGPGSTWVNNSDLNVGYAGNGSLTVSNGANVTSGNVSLGVFRGSSGSILIDGAGSKLTSSGNLNVGGIFKPLPQNGGNGSLTVSNGAHLTTSRNAFLGYSFLSSGRVLITGAGSVWANSGNLYVGNSGNGNLTILDGGNVATSGDGSLGNVSGGNGKMLVSGAGSTFNGTGNLFVGNSGLGNLAISNGGATMTGGNGYIGNASNSNGTVQVDGVGSAWINTGNLYVGNFGKGNLTISNGGNVTNFNGYIGNGPVSNLTAGSGGPGGNFAGSSLANDKSSDIFIIIIGGLPSVQRDTVVVDGAGSSWSNSGNLSVGNSGNGNLTISNGGNVTSNGGYVGNLSGSNGIVNIMGNNSIWTNNGTLTIGSGGVGSLAISSGGMLITQNLTLGLNSTLQLTLDGVLGVLYTPISVTNNLATGGSLDLSLASGFTPAFGNVFDLFQAGGIISNVFNGVILPYLSNGLDWDLSQLYADGDISTATPTIFAAWVSDMGLTGDNALPRAHPLTNSQPNLISYAMNLAITPQAVQLPAISTTTVSGVTYLTLQYRQRKNMTDVQLVPQFSTDLIQWTNVDADNITQMADDDAYTARFQASALIPVSGKIFLRVNAIQN